MKQGAFFALMLFFILFCFSGCAPGGGHYGDDHPAGFFPGIWHGWIAPVTLIISIFSDTVRIYEVHNTGWWYDLGFYIALIGGFGGISFTRKKLKGNAGRQ